MTAHRVTRGERLSEIAARYGVRAIDIVRANPRRPVQTLGSGQIVFTDLAEGDDLHVPSALGITFLVPQTTFPPGGGVCPDGTTYSKGKCTDGSTSSLPFCPPGRAWSTSLDTCIPLVIPAPSSPASTAYCRAQGGTTSTMTVGPNGQMLRSHDVGPQAALHLDATDPSTPGAVYDVCTFSDGTICRTDLLVSGECVPSAADIAATAAAAAAAEAAAEAGALLPTTPTPTPTPAPVAATIPPAQAPTAPVPTAPSASASLVMPAVTPANALCPPDTIYGADGGCHGTTGDPLNGTLDTDSVAPTCVDGYAWDAPSKTCVKKTPWLMIGLGTFAVVATGAAFYYARKAR